MTPTALAIIGATIVVSSFLSGVFGMAGGMVLLGVLLVYFDVATAMILFSIIQFFANAWRAMQWWSFVRWRIFWFYVLGAFVALLWRGVVIARRAPDLFGALLASGLTALIVGQALINMGVSLGVLPTTGIPLPFISAGGSSLVTSLAAVGLLLGISQHAR